MFFTSREKVNGRNILNQCIYNNIGKIKGKGKKKVTETGNCQNKIWTRWRLLLHFYRNGIYKKKYRHC